MTVYQGSKIAGGNQTRVNPTGVQTVISTFKVTVALVSADTIQMIKVPAGAFITGVALDAPAMDSNGSKTLTLSVGDPTTTNRFINVSTIGQAGGVQALNVAGSVGFPYTTDTIVSILCGTAAATAVLNGIITLRVDYTMDP